MLAVTDMGIIRVGATRVRALRSWEGKIGAISAGTGISLCFAKQGNDLFIRDPED